MQSNTWRPSDILTADTPGSRRDQRDVPKRRGRIPQSAWPRIVERYKAGATLSIIAREFDCTPSAISYILRKASGTTDADDHTNGGEGSEVRERKTMTLARSERRVGGEEPAPNEVGREAAQMPEGRDQRSMSANATEAEDADREAARTDAGLSADSAAKSVPTGRRDSAGQPENSAAAAGDPLETRLLDTAKGCIRAYRNWRQEPNEGSVEALREGLHNLRKTLARVEIEASTHKRDETVMRPIPIPPHRAHRSRA